LVRYIQNLVYEENKKEKNSTHKNKRKH